MIFSELSTFNNTEYVIHGEIFLKWCCHKVLSGFKNCGPLWVGFIYVCWWICVLFYFKYEIIPIIGPVHLSYLRPFHCLPFIFSDRRAPLCFFRPYFPFVLPDQASCWTFVVDSFVHVLHFSLYINCFLIRWSVPIDILN